MQLSPDDIRPFLRDHYTSSAAIWATLERRVGAFILALAGKLDRDNCADVAHDAMVALVERAERQGGLGSPPSNDAVVPWFKRCVLNQVRDLLRKQRRRADRFEVPVRERQRDDAADEPDEADAAGHEHASKVDDAGRPGLERLWTPLEDAACPPNYRLAVKAWYFAHKLDRTDVDRLAERNQSGKTDQRSGLVRPVERAWALLLQIRGRWPDGIARRADAIDRFGFTVRSDAQRYSDWAADKKAVRAARETVGKWHIRGRQWLEARMEAT